MTVDYERFLVKKRFVAPVSGIDVGDGDINQKLFPFQRDLVRWALRKGRSAIFADTGLGKTFMQIEFARLSGQPTLILAPLSVARQTVSEAQKLGVEVIYARSQADAGKITITNYEMAERFDPRAFGAVVLDESSILKATAGATRNKLIEMFCDTQYRLCCTATPAPNDIQEITNHAEFLGVMKRRDVLATFFLHDADDAHASGWRLKKHAREPFWRWLASWGMSLKHPSDIGYAEDGYALPDLEIKPVIVEGIFQVPGRLFADKLHGIVERSAVRRQTKNARVRATVELVRKSWAENQATNTTGIITPCIVSSELPMPEEATINIGIKALPSESHGMIGTDMQAASEGKVLVKRNTRNSSTNKADVMRSAGKSRGPIGDSTLTTIIRRAPSEGFSAKDAICASDDSAMIQPSYALQGTSMTLSTSKEPWIIWCGLNEEQEAVTKELGSDCISIYGSMSPEHKADLIEAWQSGEVPVLVSKVRICGFGLNLQRASHMAFVGISDSYEAYYQAIRRCWRYGQIWMVRAYIILSEIEKSIFDNVLRKEREAMTMQRELVRHVAAYERVEIERIDVGLKYEAQTEMKLPKWL